MRHLSSTVSALALAAMFLPVFAAPQDDIQTVLSHESLEDASVDALIETAERALQGEASASDTGGGDSPALDEVEAERELPPLNLKPMAYVPESAVKFETDSFITASQREHSDLLVAAREHYAAGDLESAVITAENALAFEPGSIDAGILLAELFIQQREFRHAEIALEPLLTRENTRWEAWFYAGTARLMRNDLDAASAYLDRALQLDRNHAEVWLHRAIIEQELGNHNAALQLLMVANGLDPHNPTIPLNIAYTRQTLGDNAAAARAFARYRELTGADQTFESIDVTRLASEVLEEQANTARVQHEFPPALDEQ